jgi:hypothetical protein
MKTSKKSSKPYWDMTTEELAAATREFDREILPDTFRPLGSEKQAVWERLQRQPGSGINMHAKSKRSRSKKGNRNG